jgi:hypothetical protein
MITINIRDAFGSHSPSNKKMSDTEPVANPLEPKKKQKHRKDKPWDTDDIDHWKIETFTPEDNKHHLLEESSFATLFPQVCQSQH